MQNVSAVGGSRGLPVQQASLETHAPFVDFVSALTGAYLHHAQGARDSALKLLRTALELGRRHGFVVPQLWLPQVTSELCALALSADIERDYALELIRQCALPPPLAQHAESWPWPIKIFALGRFGVLVDGQALQFSGRVQRKPLELLQAIVAFGARDVSCAAVSDALWPDLEADAAADALAKSLRRLRALLKSAAAIALRDGKLSLNSRMIWLDKLELERCLAQPIEQLNVARIVQLYRGDFLASEPHASWLLVARERLRTRVLTGIGRRGRLLLQSKSFGEAVEVFEAGVEIDPVAEDCYCHLMRCHLALGRINDGLAVYRRCQSQLATALRVAPSAETRQLHLQLRARAEATSGPCAALVRVG